MAYDRGTYGNAINEYTKALKRENSAALEGQLMAKRSAAFAALSTELRFRPATASALYGMDPYDLARLALKDGQRVSELFPRHPEGYLRQGFAHYLLENYAKAEEACLEGLRWDIDRDSLKNCLKLVKHATGDAQQQQDQSAECRMPLQACRDADDLECVLCMKLLCEPVTTPCGHSFCAQCLRRSLDHSNKCPFCRTVLHLSQELVVSVTLKTIVQKSFPEEYAERLQETADLNAASSSGSAILPLFVLTTLMPGEKMALNIFEPRYRLMVRRVMAGSRRFGMVRRSNDPDGMEKVACECEITECEPLPDGRYYLEVVGRRRIQVQELWEQDGYRVGKVAQMHDETPTDPRRVAELSTEIKASTSNFLLLLRSVLSKHGPHNSVLALLGRISEEPMASDPEMISFWAACLLPTACPQRSLLLQTTSTIERLRWLQTHLKQLWEAKKEWNIK
ncbi:unnamed protein product [Ostreobium quekettii]|uniref:LON peptidase N-terminal domain and RING finger protein 1 n=1 Tax=Ostreobium quekettii TaxID=121088 RepID=A0A8S1JAX3_9CHLO|nr:unnamed protein product [Ostreobium quekettii]